MNPFLSQLLACSNLETAAALFLRHMMDIAQRSLDGSPWASKGRLVRAMVHLRPGDGYQHLLVLESHSPTLSPLGDDDRLLPSATAWRWVAENRGPVSIDVRVARLQLGNGETVDLSSEWGAGLEAGEGTLGRLHRRDVSHLHVLPLRGPGGALVGMVSLEARCEAAAGRPFLWGECTGDLQLLADAAAPHLGAFSPKEAPTPPIADPLLPVVGASMVEAMAMLRVFAKQEEPILISGPTGAGKSRLARWCHEHSRHKAGPFEVLDLSSIPEELQMAELFGWKKGAFTSAVRDNPGLMARASGGTLFIDEIDNLSPRAQAGLLRVLEERSYRVLGDDRGERPANVRFIIGTNASLQEAVREKRFRADLYYRINVLPIRVPRLAERRDEIGPWARYMAVRRHGSKAGEAGVRLTPEAEKVLESQPWPGNLRQLDNIVRRAYAVAMMPHMGDPPKVLTIEEEHVRRALAYEGAEASAVLPLQGLVNAAASIVGAAEERGAGEPLDFDLLDGFKGFVLCAALEKCGGQRDEVFRLFGRESLIKSRNHHRVLKREMERARELWNVVGGGAPFPFQALTVQEEDALPSGAAEGRNSPRS